MVGSPCFSEEAARRERNEPAIGVKEDNDSKEGHLATPEEESAQVVLHH